MKTRVPVAGRHQAASACFALVVAASTLQAQGARLLRQPTLSPTHIAFAHGGDLWIVDRNGGEARRLTSTAAVESDPHFSKWRGRDPATFTTGFLCISVNSAIFVVCSASSASVAPDCLACSSLYAVLLAKVGGELVVNHLPRGCIADAGNGRDQQAHLEGAAEVTRPPATLSLDGNVPPYNTYLVVDALQRANKDYDLILFPNAGHGFGTLNNYMMRRRWDYFVRHLLGTEPPKEYEIGRRATP